MTARHDPSPSAFSTPASTALFRRLTWEGTVPLEIRVDSRELPAGSDRGLECYFVQAPRVSYIPLLVPEIKRFLTDIVFDGAAAKAVKEEDWWFESEDGVVMKWYATPDCVLGQFSLQFVGTGRSACYTITTLSRPH